jgi:hypothetical protein
MEFDPVGRLQTLLGPSPTEPWSALIPQILLWCFRRFCIQKLIESEGVLSESLWDDHYHLVNMYCPKGLESTSISWLTPENMEAMYSPSEEYNKFFIEFIEYFDLVIASEEYEMQDVLSGFLDTEICVIVNTWLDGSPFSIFPMDISEEDTFTEDKFTSLINALLSHVSAGKEEVEVEVPPNKEPEKPQSASFLLWQYLSIPPLIPQYLISNANSDTNTVEPPTHVEPPTPIEPPTPVEVTPIVNAKSVNTVSRAVAYRRTIRLSRHLKTSRVKTRRSHPTT